MRTVAIGVIAAILVVAGVPAARAQSGTAGKAVYDKACALCHGSGIAGAPRFGSAAEWAPRIKTGMAALYNSALRGTPKGMPGRGGNLSLSDDEVKAAVDYMVAAAGGAVAEKPKATAARAKTPAAPEPAAKAVRPPPPKAPAPAPAAAPAEQAAGDPNAFNRLMAPPSSRNPPPTTDGIHDPESPGTSALQAPRRSFSSLPPSSSGNNVDWVAAVGKQRIRPRWEINNDKAVPAVMDLNIVREVKGSMPNVVYPHKQHTEWLDCSNCHPAIFVPQKGANQISMAAILLGQKCGVCHGKVAFPVAECRRCHSGKKEEKTRAAATGSTEAKK